MIEARALVSEIAARLSRRGSDAPAREAEWLAEAVTGLSRGDLAVAGSIAPEEAEAVRALARRRLRGEPVQYLTGIAGFRRLELAVGPGVLIPRPETETVVEVALALLPPEGTLIDVGTGSGAIALSVADERPDARVVGTDDSAEALAWAVENRARLGLDVELVGCDLLSGVPALRGRVHVIVSNPPYVADSERGSLPLEVVAHEPHSALFAGSDGLGVIRRLARHAMQWLCPGGALVLEMGETQAPGARSVLENAGYVEIEMARDLAGKDRVASARVPA